jgi:drug/metabolite transporter (DMT)-like permease
MFNGLNAGILWALVTVLLSIILSKGIFIHSKEAIYLAPFVSAFLNDTFSGLWLLFFRKSRKQCRNTSVLKALKTRNGKLLLLSGLFGGPLGMSSYLLAIKYLGASYTAVISSLYPAIGALISWIFFRDKLLKKQLFGILLCGIGIFALCCALFWGMEAVISSYAMKDDAISFELALQIRHYTSIICYAFIFLPLLNAWGFTIQVLLDKSIILLLITGLLETGSYLFYYKAIHKLGATKAMTLNILYMVWAVVLGVFLFKDIPNRYEIMSILLLFSGVLFVVLHSVNSQERRHYE